MTVTQRLKILDKMLKLIDDYNNSNSNGEKIEVNWQYWLTNTIYAEQTREAAYGQGWTVYRAVSKDGLMLEVLSNEHGIMIRIGSIHKAICEYE